MRRRDLLAGLAIGVSGCLGSDADQPTGDTSASAVTTSDSPRNTFEQRTSATTPPSTQPSFPRHVSVETVDDDDLRAVFDVAVDVAVPDADVTSGGTAQVELTLRTTTEADRSLTYEQPHCGRNEFRATTDGYGLFLFPVGSEWTTGDTDCPTVSVPNLECGIPVVEETITVPATDALTWRYDVLVPPRNLDRGGCLVPGRYRFTRQFSRASRTATLSFALSVTSP